MRRTALLIPACLLPGGCAGIQTPLNPAGSLYGLLGLMLVICGIV
ncbi:hypothetical protein [Sphingomonas sp.]